MITESDLRRWAVKIGAWAVAIGCLALIIGEIGSGIKHAATRKAQEAARNPERSPNNAWIELMPGNKIDIPLEKVRAPILVKGLWTFEFDFVGPPPDAYADIEADGVPVRLTPSNHFHLTRNAGQEGEVLVKGGKGVLRISMEITTI